jgi:hypothetical protein
VSTAAEEADERAAATPASASTTAKEAYASSVAAPPCLSTAAKEANERAEAVPRSASTAAKDADASSAVALSSAIMCESSTRARTVLLRPQAHLDVKGRWPARLILAWHSFSGQHAFTGL